MNLLTRIERHLRQSGTPPSRFGRDAVSDPRLVHDLRLGRQPGIEMRIRIEAFLADAERRG